VVLAGAVGLALMADTARRTSATYDEVAYLRVAARWWRTGDQEEITRMGSPLTFWKLQQAPVLWALDRLGHSDLNDDPESRQADLLPRVRIGALWVWLVAFGLTAWWSRRLYGPKAMALAAWLFALSPNLLAHGALVTMELPLVAATAGVFVLFSRFLRHGRRRDLWSAAAVCGLAFSCKFTAALFPIWLGLVWWFERVRVGRRRPFAAAAAVGGGMTAFVAVMLVTDVVVTAGARLPLSHSSGQGHPSLDGKFGPALGRLVTRAAETPLPQDWVGFATQLNHQRSGGSSYLLGQRRSHGWWYYYVVALAVKVPLSFWLLAGARAWAVRCDRHASTGGDAWIPVAIAAFVVITALGSSRNYGVRYLLPLAPLAVVWVSALADTTGWGRLIVCAGLAGQALTVVGVHPNELTYFNALAGGPEGGRRVLADSNLDWGQGLISLARLQRERPELRDLTLYYFGDTHPRHYGVAGPCHVVDAGNDRPGLPPMLSASTRFVAVSASLQWGPWGPVGYFRALDAARPIASTDDTTITVYRTSDIPPRSFQSPARHPEFSPDEVPRAR
jgi:hypothetical protein